MKKEKLKKESYAVYRKYQMAIHNDTPEDCDEKGYQRFLCDSPLPVRFMTIADSLTFDLIKTKAALCSYNKYNLVSQQNNPSCFWV